MHLTDSQVFTELLPQWRQSKLWFEQDAARALTENRYRFVHGRTDRDIYLIRCWLVQPEKIVAGEEEILSSSNAVMLHFFPRGDDDQCLHNHPWHFRTTILQGGYAEHLPPASWLDRYLHILAQGCTVDQEGRPIPGPDWDREIQTRDVGESVEHQAWDLHCVGTVLPDTWTLVRTSPKIASWGFHPPGKPFVGWRAYLDSLVPR
jgi:hypothetical protein